MLELIGNTALSVFRKQLLLNKVTQIVATVSDINAEYIHFADITEELSDKELDTLKQVLS
ncbi:MAG: phosphoribosylformylglycinamidine synthase, partial [Cycloclasticus sp.]